MATKPNIFSQYKTPIIIGVVLFVLVLLLIFGRRLMAWISSGMQVANIGTISAGVVASNLSFPKNQYIIFADNIHEAMNGQGTDEETIEGVFAQMQTYDDVSQLITAFGLREITDERFWILNATLSLSQAIKNEMDATEISRINSALAAKQINYRF